VANGWEARSGLGASALGADEDEDEDEGEGEGWVLFVGRRREER
jgi:hypothetical protein